MVMFWDGSIDQSTDGQVIPICIAFSTKGWHIKSSALENKISNLRDHATGEGPEKSNLRT